MRILGVTTWQTACGIAEYAALLQDAATKEGLPLQFQMELAALDPAWLLDATTKGGVTPRVVWLNYHAALHSRWTPDWVERFQARGYPVVITYHDTYDGTESPNSDRAKELAEVASAFIVHEPVSDIPEAMYLRQGIPDWEPPLGNLTWQGFPVLGTVGFPFPWKNYDRLAAVTEDAGWGLFLMAPTATEADDARWRAINPRLWVERHFLPASEVVARLGACHASAFMYECHNTGTSGAIRQGIAALKPVYALATCRQFRDLDTEDERRMHNLRWCQSWESFALRLRGDPILDPDSGRDPGCVYLAHRDSWRRQARRYAEIFEGVRA